MVHFTAELNAWYYPNGQIFVVIFLEFCYNLQFSGIRPLFFVDSNQFKSKAKFWLTV